MQRERDGFGGVHNDYLKLVQIAGKVMAHLVVVARSLLVGVRAR